MAITGGKQTLAIHYDMAFHSAMIRRATTGLLMVLSACDTQPNRADPMSAFVMIDADRNGKVSGAEWKRMVDVATAQLPAGPAAEEYRCRNMELFGSLDTDQDGELSSAEWKNGKFESGPDVCPSSLRL